LISSSVIVILGLYELSAYCLTSHFFHFLVDFFLVVFLVVSICSELGDKFSSPSLYSSCAWFQAVLLTFSEITVSVVIFQLLPYCLANSLNHCSIKKSTSEDFANDFQTKNFAAHFQILAKSHFQVITQSTQLAISHNHSILEYVSVSHAHFLL
jgi:hypothetical protein